MLRSLQNCCRKAVKEKRRVRKGSVVSEEKETEKKEGKKETEGDGKVMAEEGEEKEKKALKFMSTLEFIEDAIDLVLSPIIMEIPFFLASRIDIDEPAIDKFLKNAHGDSFARIELAFVFAGLGALIYEYFSGRYEDQQRDYIPSQKLPDGNRKTAIPLSKSAELILKPQRNYMTRFALWGPQLLFGFVSLMVGMGLFKRFKWGYMVISSLMFLVLSILDHQQAEQSHDVHTKEFGLFILLFTYCLADFQLREHTFIGTVAAGA